MKINITSPKDIPSNWPILLAQKVTSVQIRESSGIETFSVSWQDSVLTSDPEVDLIIIQPNGNEYPCKRDIFNETYENVGESDNYIKKELSRLVQIPEDAEVIINTLEGTLNSVKHPDYIVIGKKNELYANTFEWVQTNLKIK